MVDRVGLVRAAAATAGAVVLAGSAVACGSSDGGGAGTTQKDSLKIDWVTSADKPGCSYDAPTKTVTAQLSIDGYQSEKSTKTLVVTAYADENTSQPVGSKSTVVTLSGIVHQLHTVTFQVSKPPKVDVDGVAACKRELTD